MPHIDIIVRTHFPASRDTTKKRYCGAEKPEVTRRCLISLVNSVNALENEISAHLVLFDDHSDEKYLEIAREILRALRSPHTFEIISFDDASGPTATMIPAFTWGFEKSKKDLLYFLEDDYLHDPSAVSEMVNARAYFSHMLGGGEVALYPFNDPYRYYIPKNIELTRIVHGPKRHWRLNFFTSGTFFTTHATLAKHFETISALGKVPVSSTMEDDTINKVWKNEGVTLFTPIPSLALHLQFDSEKDPYIEWEKWWERNARIMN